MYTAEEYRNLMISVITMTIREAENERYDTDSPRKPGITLAYQDGYIAGLEEAKRKLEVSEFLSNPEFKD